MLHQVFNGRMDVGLNRNLAITILKDGQLTDKIVIAQKSNDEEWYGDTMNTSLVLTFVILLVLNQRE